MSGRQVVHRLWITLWTTCGAPGVCCGSHLVRKNHSGWRQRVVRRRRDDVRTQGLVAALRRIAFLLERSRAETYKVKAFRAAADTDPAAGRRGRAAGGGGDAARAGGRRRVHRRGDRGGGAGTDAAAAGEAGAGGRRTARARRRARPGGAAWRPALPQRLVRRGLAHRGDGVHRDRARSRVPRAHRPLAPPDGGQRALGGTADPPARGGRGDQRATWVPGPSGCSRGSRSTSSTTARSTRPRRCSVGSTCAWPRCTPSWPWTPSR